MSRKLRNGMVQHKRENDSIEKENKTQKKDERA